MKWKDLSLKERKQIYDSVRVNNPDATYFDIKEQFDSIPAYEDGKGKTINKADLPPEYRTGTPEYFERQRKISGAVNAVQPEAYITPVYGRTTGKVDQPTIEDMTISLNPDYYLEETANHEISHLADALVNKVHSADATNNYIEYLLDRDNIMSYNEIRQSLMDVNPSTYRYLTTPSENKAHMIQLKRGMQKEGIINNWTDPITQDKIEEYLSYRSKYANRVNPVLRTLYDIRPDKQGFINRMNNLTPIEWAAPLGLPMFFGEEQENK